MRGGIRHVHSPIKEPSSIERKAPVGNIERFLSTPVSLAAIDGRRPHSSFMTLPASRLCLSETPSVIPQALLLSPRSPALPKSSSTLSTQFILVQSKFKKPFPLPPHSSFLEQEGLQQPSLSAFFRGERHRPFFYLPDLPTHHPPPPAFPSTPPPLHARCRSSFHSHRCLLPPLHCLTPHPSSSTSSTRRLASWASASPFKYSKSMSVCAWGPSRASNTYCNASRSLGVTPGCQNRIKST